MIVVFVRGLCRCRLFLGEELGLISRWFGRYRGRASRGPISDTDYHSIVRINYSIRIVNKNPGLDGGDVIAIRFSQFVALFMSPYVYCPLQLLT